jgi:ubiquinone/menaquinone biosynthesis C-methylase UbiE
LGDRAQAAAQVAEMRELFAHPDEPPMSELVQLDVLDLEAAYGAWAKTYDAPNALVMLEEPVLRDVLSMVSPSLALDVGCGSGRVARLLRSLGHRVVGVDPSLEMLERAQSKDIGVPLIRAEVEALPIRSAAVDLVTCALTLTHLEHIDDAMAELARILRPGGTLVLSDIHPVAVATGGQAFFTKEDGSRGLTVNHVHWPSDYIRAFRAFGLVIERCEEPLVDRAFFDEMVSPDVRAAAEPALLGLPIALIWALRRESR